MKKSKMKDWFVNFFMALGIGVVVPGLLLLGLPPDDKADDVMWGAWLLVIGFLSTLASFIMAVFEDWKGEDV